MELNSEFSGEKKTLLREAQCPNSEIYLLSNNVNYCKASRVTGK